MSIISAGKANIFCKTKNKKTQTSTITAFALVSLWRLLSIVNVNLSFECECSERITTAKMNHFYILNLISLARMTNIRPKSYIDLWLLLVYLVPICSVCFYCSVLTGFVYACLELIICRFFFGLTGRFSHEKSQITENDPDLK